MGWPQDCACPDLDGSDYAGLTYSGHTGGMIRKNPTMQYSQKWCDQYMLIENPAGCSPEGFTCARKMRRPTACHR